MYPTILLYNSWTSVYTVGLLNRGVDVDLKFLYFVLYLHTQCVMVGLFMNGELETVWLQAAMA